MDIVSMQLELLTGKIKQVKKQIETIERNRRNVIAKSIATSTPKSAKNRTKITKTRHKRELSRWLGRQKLKNKKSLSSDTTVESVESEDSDCELVEQPSDLIILDEDSKSSSSSVSRGNSSSNEDSPASENPIQENSTVESGKIADNDSSCLFYEDREPSINYSIPLYDSVQCVVVDSSIETIDATPAAEPNEMSPATLSMGTMPRLFTIRNENYDRNGGNRVSVKDRLGNQSQKIIGNAVTDTATSNTTTSNSISLDTPRVPTMNVRISVQPTERDVTTRTCTFTSSASKSSETIASSGREVLRAETCASNVETVSKPKPFQITITNECAPSTSVAVAAESEKNDASASLIAKRRRKDSDVILIDEMLSDNRQDDSVIFVSESMNTGRPLVSRPGKRKGGPLISFGSDYIPVASGKQVSPLANVRKKKSTRAQRKADKKTERRQALEASREQQTSSSSVIKPAPKDNNNDEKKAAEDPNELEKRMIIIDGSNVAFKHSGPENQFSVKGVELCLDYFLSRGFVAKAVVPQMRLHKSTDPKRLNDLVKLDRIVLTPCKNLGGKKSISYDDRFILDIAAGFDAAIISNDNYNDLIGKKPEWDQLIKNRVVGFAWCSDLIIFPFDPYGRDGPKLDQILYKDKPKVADGNESKPGNDEKKTE